ncbi:uncharacterized protein METZ01_LOCUS167208, partial [marine metagenome]
PVDRCDRRAGRLLVRRPFHRWTRQVCRVGPAGHQPVLL